MSDREHVHPSSSPSDCLEELERHALLAGIDSDAVADGPAAPDGWRPSDFASRFRELTSSELGRLRDLCERLAAEAGSQLSIFLRRRADLELLSLAVTECAELTRSLPRPASLHIVGHSNPSDTLVLSVAPRLLLAGVELLLGGGLSARADGDLHPMTPLEEEVSRTLVRQLLHSIEEIWKDAGIARLEVLQSEEDARFLDFRQPDEPIALAAFNLRITDGEESLEGDIHLALSPGPLLERITSASAGPPHPSPVLARLVSEEVTLSAEWTTAPLRLTEILTLHPGDAIDTGLTGDSPLTVLLDGAPLVTGRAGMRDGSLAIELGAARLPGSAT